MFIVSRVINSQFFSLRFSCAGCSSQAGLTLEGTILLLLISDASLGLRAEELRKILCIASVLYLQLLHNLKSCL